MNQDIINFYSGTGTDDKGRTLQELIAWCSDDLEGSHDFIQWMFPLMEPSRFNPDAPLLDDDTIAEFQSNPVCMRNLRLAADRMMDFYEFHKRRDGVRTLPGRLVWCYSDETSPGGKPNTTYYVKPRAPWWAEPNDHNYLRLTRMLRSLNLLGFMMYSDMLIGLLEEVFSEYYNKVGISTFEYWCAAVGRECVLSEDSIAHKTYTITDGEYSWNITIPVTMPLKPKAAAITHEQVRIRNRQSKANPKRRASNF